VGGRWGSSATVGKVWGSSVGVRGAWGLWAGGCSTRGSGRSWR